MATAGDHLRALPGAGINQTSFMFGAAIFAFAFFITVRGDLGQWLGLLGLASYTPPAPQPATQPDASGASAPSLPASQSPGAGGAAGAGGMTQNTLPLSSSTLGENFNGLTLDTNNEA